MRVRSSVVRSLAQRIRRETRLRSVFFDRKASITGTEIGMRIPVRDQRTTGARTGSIPLGETLDFRNPNGASGHSL